MTKKKKQNKVFKLLTISLIVLFFAIPIVDGLTGNFYGNETISSLLTLFVLCFFYILALADGLMKYKDKKRRIFICFLTIGNALLFLLHSFIPINLIVAFIVYNTILDLYYIFYAVIYKTQYYDGEKADLTSYTMIAMFLPWLICLISLYVCSHLDETLLILYSLILTGVLVAIFTVLSLTVFKDAYVVFTERVFVRVLAFVGIVVVLFLYSFLVTSAVNTGFPSQQYTASYEIVDKKIHSGGRAPTTYDLYIVFNGEKISIDVSSELYKEKEIGENLAVDYFSGFLNIPYLVSGE